MPFGNLRVLLVLNHEAKDASKRYSRSGQEGISRLEEAVYRSAFLQTIIALLNTEGEYSGSDPRALEFYHGITEKFGLREYDVVQKLLEEKLKEGHIPDKQE